MLPEEYQQTDLQRVCKFCFEKLSKQQKKLSNSIGNHKKANHIVLASYQHSSIIGSSTSDSSIDNSIDSCVSIRYMNLPYSTMLSEDIRKASYTVHNIIESSIIRDRELFINLIRNSCGIAFITVAKVGMMIAPRGGSGLVISRLSKTLWSPPCAIGLLGISCGAMIGADITDYIIILNDSDAVKAFTGDTYFNIGAGVNVSIGTLGRCAEVSIGNGGGMCTLLSYSQCRGLYAGVSIDSSVIITRNKMNHNFYGCEVSSKELLWGRYNDGINITRPVAAEVLYNALDLLVKKNE